MVPDKFYKGKVLIHEELQWVTKSFDYFSINLSGQVAALVGFLT